MSGPVTTIVNYATTTLPFTLAQLAASLQAFGDNYIFPEWGVTSTVQILDPAPPAAGLDAALAGQRGLVIYDNSDQAGALGYHLLAPDGQPRAACFAETTIAAGEDFAVTCSHEYAEMLADPDCDSTKGPIMVAKGRKKGAVFYILEICDAVEDTSFAVLGLNMSNFVLREWFNPASGVAVPAGAKFDYLGQLTKPLQLQAGGYISIWSQASGWDQLYGSATAKKHFNKFKKDNPYSRHGRRMAKALRAI